MVTYIEYVKVPMPARQVLLLRGTFLRLVEASQPRELKSSEHGPIRTLKSMSRHWSFNV